jgi:hypothetical protein
MKTRAQLPGWDGLSWQWNPGDGDRDAIPAGKTPSSFESEQLQKRILEAVRTAEKDDFVSIQQIMSQWDEVYASQEVKLAFMQAVFDFFIRINDPKEASIWLQKLGQLSSSGTSNPMDCISSLITA